MECDVAYSGTLSISVQGKAIEIIPVKNFISENVIVAPLGDGAEPRLIFVGTFLGIINIIGLPGFGCGWLGVGIFGCCEILESKKER